MNEIARSGVYRSEGQHPKHKRFPHLGPGDRELLDQLEPEAARIFERELQRQHDSDDRQRRITRRLQERTTPRRRRRPTYPPHD